MTKKVNTDPNFPPPATEPDLDGLLADLGKPTPLDHKEKRSSSAGTDAAEYQAEPRVPPQRAEHNTFPNAPVIVHQTDPGIAPPPNVLQVTPEERKRLDEEFEYRRKAREALKPEELAAAERNADTGPRRMDPPGVTSDPPRPSTVSKTIVALALVVVVVVTIVAIAMRTKTSTSTVSTTTTTASTRTTGPIVSATTTSTSPIAPTATTTQTIPVVVTSTRPTATHTNVVGPPTATTGTPTATTTATAVLTGTIAPPDIRGTN